MEHVLRFLSKLSVLILIVCAGCAAPPPPDDGDPDDDSFEVFMDPQAVSARVVLPEGVDEDQLVVRTIAEDSAVGADGMATPTVITQTPSLASVIEPGGKIVLLGFLRADNSANELSSRTTAEALLFFSIGGFAIPAESIDDMLGLISGSSTLEELTTAIEAAIRANPTAVSDGGADLETALAAAHDSLLGESNAAKRISRTAKGHAGNLLKLPVRAQGGGSQPILLSPDANTVQSGVQVLQNDEGAGIIALNNFRRRATLFAYQVSSQAEGESSPADLNPPVLLGTPVEIPGTVRLSALTSLGSITGNVPWAPVRSDAVSLPLLSGSTETNYKLVVLGPSLGGVTGLAFSDPQLAAFQADWNAKIDDLQYEMMLWDFVIPIIEFASVGVGTSVPVNVRAASISGFRALIDPELAAVGIALDITRSSGLRTFLQSLMADLADPARQPFARNLLTQILTNDVQLAARSISLQQMERGLVATLAARTVLVAVDIAMGALDLHAVLNDLSQSSRDEVWTATVIPQPVRINPSSVTLTDESDLALFTVSVNGRPNDTFLYRWSTSGQNGRIFDAFGAQGSGYDSTDPTAQYIVNQGAVAPGRLDTVTVEVFEDNAADVIPADAVAIGSATATVNGRNSDDCELLDIPTRPATDFFSIQIPQSVSRGGTMDIVITIDGPAIEAYLGNRSSGARIGTLSVSGAFDVTAGENQSLILLDGQPIVDAPIGNISGGSIGVVTGNNMESITVNSGLVISGGGLILFETNGVTTHTLTVPISTNARFTCSEFNASFVTASLNVDRDPVNDVANTFVYEQFAITD